MNLGITVKELHSMCDEQIAKGNGDKHIIIIDGMDTEIGYHSFNCVFTTDKELLKWIIDVDDEEHTVDNCVALD